jgi:hypothetical protein
MLKLTTASLGAALLLTAADFGTVAPARADDPSAVQPAATTPRTESTVRQPATTDPVTGPPTRRGTAPNPYWGDYWRWYDNDYRSYYTRNYSSRMPARDVEEYRARSGLGSTRRSGPYHREHYLFYERDRRFNPNPFPGGGGNYNLVR